MDTFDPETGEYTLRNLMGERNADVLRKKEQAMVAARSLQWKTGAVDTPTTFGELHLKAIHRHLFQDV